MICRTKIIHEPAAERSLLNLWKLSVHWGFVFVSLCMLYFNRKLRRKGSHHHPASPQGHFTNVRCIKARTAVCWAQLESTACRHVTVPLPLMCAIFSLSDLHELRNPNLLKPKPKPSQSLAAQAPYSSRALWITLAKQPASFQGF